MKLFPYIYEPDNSIEVLEKTNNYLLENPLVKEEIGNLGWVYHTVGLIIPQTVDNIWSGHYFPYRESWDELQISYNLVCFGFYKQAMVSLRSGLELGMLSVYYNINDDGHKTVKKWLASKENTPFAKKIWEIILSNSNIKSFNDKFNLKRKFDELGFLHDYVHSKGYHFNNSQKRNSQNFDTEKLNKWLQTYREIITLISTLHLLKYPLSVVRFDYDAKFGIDIPNFGNLEWYNIDKIAEILPEGYLREIELISTNDESVQNTIKELNELPDKTEEEVEEQILNMDKFLIEHGDGFPKWLEQKTKELPLYNRTDFNEKEKARIETLRIWATENGFLIPIQIRLGFDKLGKP